MYASLIFTWAFTVIIFWFFCALLIPQRAAVALSNQTLNSSTTEVVVVIRMEVDSARLDYLPSLLAAKTSKLSLLIKHHILTIDEVS